MPSIRSLEVQLNQLKAQHRNAVIFKRDNHAYDLTDQIAYVEDQLSQLQP